MSSTSSDLSDGESPDSQSDGSEVSTKNTRGVEVHEGHQNLIYHSESEDSELYDDSEVGQRDQFRAEVCAMSSTGLRQWLLTLAQDPDFHHVGALSTSLRRFEESLRSTERAERAKFQKDSRDKADENIAKMLSIMQDIEENQPAFGHILRFLYSTETTAPEDDHRKGVFRITNPIDIRTAQQLVHDTEFLVEHNLSKKAHNGIGGRHW